MKNISIRLFILILTLSSCSLTGKVPPIEYFTLERIEHSCLNSAEVSGPAYLLSDKIVIKKKPHAVGSIPSAYWISPLQSMLSEVLINKEGFKNIKVRIQDLSFNAKTKEVELEALTEECDQNSCQTSTFSLRSATNDHSTLSIIESYQEVLTKMILELCPVNELS